MRIPFIHNPKDFWSGVIFSAFGVTAIVMAQDYVMGDAGEMGPAYFPTILGGLLVLVGLAAILRSCLKAGEGLGKFAVKEGLLILFAVVMFGVLVRAAGLFLAIAVLVFIGGLASAKFRILPFLALAVGMAVFSVLVFVTMLGVPMPVVGSWFGS
jgi:hypothetical protein